MGLFDKIFGTRSEREVKKLRPTVDKILAMEKEYADLSEEALKGKTAQFKARLAKGETLDDLLPEAFAAVREAAWRVLGMKPYPVQLIGGIVLHQGRIAEMKTGEGKTLVEVMPTYLNALTGEGVHVVTVNDYLAKRDSEWMGKVFRYMGLTVGLVIRECSREERRQAYAADITYCSNSELGFDYLRDNMALYKESMVQRGHRFVIVDEVDSILIDEARTPLVLSGAAEESSDLYRQADAFVSGLKKRVFSDFDKETSDREDGLPSLPSLRKKETVEDDYGCDYYGDQKSKTVSLTSRGIAKAERYFQIENLADAEHAELNHHINLAMRAHALMKRDVEYVVKDGKVIIVDESTGRLQPGRRFRDGLHQALEVKEGVLVVGESKTLASITYQNYFRLYTKLSGMTGTAMTEEQEFGTIYGLDVVEIPTNRPVIRKDHNDVLFLKEAEKYRAVIAQIKACHAKGQPVLVGTVSVEKSEMLSKMLKAEGIKHNVLNAKNHHNEAKIVAQAGCPGAVTIATNMAGRGTDIMLGGNAEFKALSELTRQGVPEELQEEARAYSETTDEEVLNIRGRYAELVARYKAELEPDAEKVRQAGGLFIIGTERHESRRVDNQLRGRAGRQGDPGESRFYVSLEDDVTRVFANDRVKSVMDTAQKLLKEDDNGLDSKAFGDIVENAQKAVESRNFNARKNVLEYDNVLNTQREIIYGQRLKVLDGEDLKELMLSNLRKVIGDIVTSAAAEHGGIHSQTELQAVLKQMEGIYFPAGAVRLSDGELAAMKSGDLEEKLYGQALQTYEQKEAHLGSENMRRAERVVMLQTVDQCWMEQLDAMEELKRDVQLRGYGQHDPLEEYKQQGFAMFQSTVDTIRELSVRRMFIVRFETKEEYERRQVAKVTGTGNAGAPKPKPQPVRRAAAKVGPNDPCPCGSGKKYKKCCMHKDKTAGRENG